MLFLMELLSWIFILYMRDVGIVLKVLDKLVDIFGGGLNIKIRLVRNRLEGSYNYIFKLIYKLFYILFLKY